MGNRAFGGDYTEGDGSMLSGVSTGVNAPQMNSLNKQVSGGHRDPHHQNQTVAAPGKLRKASPEALALLMANKEKHEKMSNNASHWVPSGGAA